MTFLCMSLFAIYTNITVVFNKLIKLVFRCRFSKREGRMEGGREKATARPYPSQPRPHPFPPSPHRGCAIGATTYKRKTQLVHIHFITMTFANNQLRNIYQNSPKSTMFKLFNFASMFFVLLCSRSSPPVHVRQCVGTFNS